MRNLIIIIILFITCATIALSATLTGANTADDERCVSFSVSNRTNITTWVLRDSLHYKKSEVLQSNGGAFSPIDLKTVFGVSVVDFEVSAPAFPCVFESNEFGVIAANPLVSGKYYGSDLYWFDISGSTPKAVRLDGVNEKSWDDCPSLSVDGEVLFFASDRNDPYSGKTDIFYCFRSGNGFSNPIELKGVNTKQFSETSPFLGPDCYLYFSSDRDSSYDIYRVKLDENMNVVGVPKKLDPADFGAVNSPISNEYSPVWSQAGKFFLYSSNINAARNGAKDFDIYVADKHDFTLPGLDFVFDFESKTNIDYFDEIKGIDKTREEPFEADLEIMSSDFSKSARTQGGKFKFGMHRNTAVSPGEDFRYREMKLYISGQCCRADTCPIRTERTYVYDALCSEDRFDLEEIIYCKERVLPIRRFITDTIPFFVTGYWCPSTKEFKDYTLCSNIFDITTKCPTEPQEKQVQFDYGCESNEIYTFYNFYNPIIKPRYNVKWTEGSACIDRSELSAVVSEKLDYATEVDGNIKSLVEEMRLKVLDDPYAQRALDQGKKITVKVYGWTDRKDIDHRCAYTGEDIIFAESFINIADSAKLNGKYVKKDYLKDGVLENGTHFVGQWSHGNQLLSDLRAYYMADLMHKVWYEKLPEYRKHFDAGLIEFEACGLSVRSLPGKSLAVNRSVDIEVLIDLGKDDLSSSGAGANPSQTRTLCSPKSCFKR